MKETGFFICPFQRVSYPCKPGGLIHKKSGTKSFFVSEELIVRFKLEVSQEEIRALIARAGARIKRSIEAIDYVVISLPPSLPVNEALEWFRQQGGVEKAEPNYLIPSVFVLFGLSGAARNGTG